MVMPRLSPMLAALLATSLLLDGSTSHAAPGVIARARGLLETLPGQAGTERRMFAEAAAAISAELAYDHVLKKGDNADAGR